MTFYSWVNTKAQRNKYDAVLRRKKIKDFQQGLMHIY